MQITLTPVRREARLTASVAGDVLTLNDEDFDFSALPEGALLPREAIHSDWFASDVERVGGEITLTLVVPHDATAPEETLFPAPPAPGDGPLALPPYGENA